MFQGKICFNDGMTKIVTQGDVALKTRQVVK